jgi:Flp pilus assembly protein TadG
MYQPRRSDRSSEDFVRRLGDTCGAPRRRDRESGQATVEFALILFPLLIIVVGIIQFGIGLSYWLDMNRLANQGARWAVVNGWPNCPRTQGTACNAATVGPSNRLDVYIESEALTQGLESAVNATVCYPDDGDASTTPGTVGTPVRVRLDAPFTFRAIMKLGSINLRATATMRIENDKPFNHLTGTLACP